MENVPMPDIAGFCYLIPHSPDIRVLLALILQEAERETEAACLVQTAPADLDWLLGLALSL